MKRVWVSNLFIGVRTGRFYWKLRDTDRHPLLFSERNGRGYRRIIRVGPYEFGVKR